MDTSRTIDRLATKLAGAGFTDEEAALLRRLLTPAEEVEAFGYATRPLGRGDWVYLIAAAHEYRSALG